MTSLTEETTKLRYITPALQNAGWNLDHISCEDYFFTDGKIAIDGGTGKRVNKGNKTDYQLCWPDANQPLAVVEAKDYQKTVGHGLQQAIDYAVILDVDFAYSSNGHAFMEHDMTTGKERQIPLDEFPSPDDLWNRHCAAHGLTVEQAEETKTPYYYDYDSITPRYYQRIAINRVVEAVAKGRERILLVMATGTGKTYTAFQIVWRLRRARLKKKILYLADRNVLLDQTISGDFKPLNSVTTKVQGKKLDSAYEVFFSSYQQLVDEDKQDPDAPQPYEQLDPNFFDLVIVDECHRGSARADSSWRRVLRYFKSATQIGMTATPKETKDASSSNYFGEPVYTYSLKQGIEDGFLAPYRVKRIHISVDDYGFIPEEGQLDDNGELIEHREYTQKDINRNIVFTKRDTLVAQEVTKYLKAEGRFQKTIVFCVDIDHAERMRQALVNENDDIVQEHPDYIQRCTGDVHGVEKILDKFMDDDETFPTILTTSKLLTTGVNCKTCRCIVLDNTFGEQGMTEFKQIVGRGTRIKESKGKLYFTVLDFKNATRLFADPGFDGDPPVIYDPPDVPGDGPTPEPPDNPNPPEPPSGTVKYYVSNLDVEVTGEQVQYYWMGKLHTESLVDYTRKNMRSQYSTLDDFIKKWNSEDRKAAICEELEKQGVFIEQLRDQTGRDDLDDFDLLCHIAYDVPAMTRKERAQAVKDSGYLDQFNEAAKKVLEALLDKYATAQIRDLDDISILQLKEFQRIGSVPKIVKMFGGKEQFLHAAQALENELYRMAA
jgi:type I restriction enzyme R subunit